MAIGTDDAIFKYGTLDDIGNSSSSVADAAFSVSGDLTSWTNDDDAPMAMAALTWQYASGTLSAGASVNLHARRLNYTGTTDEEVPSGDYAGALVGTFIVDDGLATATNSVAMIKIALNGFKTSQEYEFYIENNTGVTISAGWKIELMPIAIGPHA